MSPRPQRSHSSDGIPTWIGFCVGVLALGVSLIPGQPIATRPRPEDSPRAFLRLLAPDGSALPEVEVSLREGERTWSVQTDAEGFAERGRAEVARVVLDPFLPLSSNIPPEHNELLTLRLEARPTLVGHVRTPFGIAASGAEVIRIAVNPDGSEGERSVATTDERGRFEFPQIDLPGRLSVSHPEGSAWRSLASDEERVDLVIQTGNAIGGVVYDPEGSPSAARVTIVGSGIWPARQTEADEYGRFRFDGVADGVYELHARAQALVADPIQGIRVENGDQEFVTLRLGQGRRVAGVVRSLEGEPIEDAELSASVDGVALLPHTTLSRSDGRFVFPGLPEGPVWLSVRATGYVATQLFLPAEEDEEEAARRDREADADPAEGPIEVEDLEIELVQGGRVYGYVYDAQDRPVRGAVVRFLVEADPLPQQAGAQNAEPGEAMGGGLGVTLGPVPPIPLEPGDTPDARAPLGGSAVTDRLGRYELDGLPPGVGEVFADHPSHAPTISDSFRLNAGDARRLDLVIPEGTTIDGRVVDARGFGLGSVLVELRTEREPWARTTITGRDGAFSFEGAIGTVVLTARPEELTPLRERFEIEEGAERQEVILAVPADLQQLALRVFDPRGFPVSGAMLSLASLRSDAPLDRHGVSSEDGTFVFSALPPPPYRLEVDPRTPELATFATEVETIENELRVDLGAAFLLRGNVLDPSDAPLRGVRVRVQGPQGIDRIERTDASGGFSLERVPAGDYELRFVAEGYLPLESSETLDLTTYPDGQATLDPVRLGQGSGIDVLVVDAILQPAPRTEVALVDEAGEVLEERTDGEGVAHFFCPPGRYRVGASHEEGGDVGGMTVAVDAGERREERLVLPGRISAEASESVGSARRVGVPLRLTRDGGAIVIAGTFERVRGIRRGDILLSVDDESVLSLSHAEGLLRGPEGDVAVLQIQRGSRTRRVRAERIRYREPE